MSSTLALLLVSLFVLLALILDHRQRPQRTWALWIPQAWLWVIASRPLAGWIAPGSGWDSSINDGSALDRNVLTVLILMAGVVLVRRRLQWMRWVAANPWVVAFFLYCGLSVLWSDFPAVALKRWFRAIGSVMMVLVVLSESHPSSAIVTLVQRCAYVLIPFSIVIIKYFRAYGVGYNPWTGTEYLEGVTTDKNALGRLCLVVVLFGVWEFLSRADRKAVNQHWTSRFIKTCLLVITVWLLYASKSATSLATLLFGCSVLLALKLAPVRRGVKYLGTLVTVAALLALLVIFTTDIAELIVTSLGRDLTFTDRTFVWADLIATGTNPLVGVGYDSFWLGERLARFMRVHQVNEAHNGYLEIYLELGLIGVFLFIGILFSVFRSAKRLMSSDFEQGRLRLAFLAVFLLYNVTEAGYKVTTLMFFMLLLTGMNAPQALPARARAAVRNLRSPLPAGSFRKPPRLSPNSFTLRKTT